MVLCRTAFAQAGYYVSFFISIISYKYNSFFELHLIIILPRNLFSPMIFPLSSVIGSENRTVQRYHPLGASDLCLLSKLGRCTISVAVCINSGIACVAFALPIVPYDLALNIYFFTYYFIIIKKHNMNLT